MNNRLYITDNINILSKLDSSSIDLIYLDPPFNSNTIYKGVIDITGEEISFKDKWNYSDINTLYLNKIKNEHLDLYHYISIIHKIHSVSMYSYILYMSQRLIEMHRILKNTGCLYLHCDHSASHYLKIVLDYLFGDTNFRDEIIWQRSRSLQKGTKYRPKKFGRSTDVILFYSKTNNFHLKNTRPINSLEEKKLFDKIDENKDRYNTRTPIFRNKALGNSPSLCYIWRGYSNPHPSGWRFSKESLEKEYIKGNIVITKDKKLERRSYLKDYKGIPIGNLWSDIKPLSSKERVGYPTQKPLSLLKRIILASTNPGDIVLDPFCGCGTTCIASTMLSRQWIAIDIEPKVINIIKNRFNHINHKLFKYNIVYNIETIDSVSYE